MKWKQTLAISIAALGLAAVAQAEELPRGRWWRRPEIVRAITLNEEQQRRLDAISRDAANDLIDAKAAVDKAAVALRSELDQPSLTRDSVQRLAARLTEARGRLFERELMMLVDMRGVLNEQQWTKLRSEMERRGFEPGLGAPPPRQPHAPMAPGMRPGATPRAPRPDRAPQAPPPAARP